MKRAWMSAIMLLVLMTLYSSGLAHGHPRPAYSPSTTRDAWLNPATIFHPDEFAYVGKPYRMLLTDNWNPHYYHNPSLTLYANLGLFWLSGAEDMPHDTGHGDRSIAPFQLHVMARWLSALYTLVAVVLTYTAGRVAFNRRAGMVAAALVALSPLTVEHAHYATPIALTTLMATAALCAALVIAKKKHPAYVPLWALYVIAGLLVGLTMAARYNAVVVGLVTGLAMLTAWRSHRRWFPLLVGFTAMPVGFALGTPGIIFATNEVIDQIRDILDWYQVRGGGPGFTTGRGWSGLYYHWRYVVLLAVGPVGIGAALAGLVIAWRADRRSHPQDAWIAGVLALYIFVYAILALPGNRLQANLLPPLIAPLALLAGYALSYLTSGWRQVGVWLALLWPAILSALFAYRITVPDTRMRAQEWIYAHVPRGSKVYLIGPYNVPLDPLDYAIHQTFAREADPEDVQQSDAQIIVYSDAYPWIVLRDRSLSSPEAITREEGIREALQAGWIELKHFDRMPWPGENIAPDDVSYWHQMEITIYCNPANCPVTPSR